MSNLADCDTQSAHLCWSSVGASTRDVQKACTKLRITSGTYLTMLAANKFFKCDPICQLCFKEPESIQHMLLSCPALHEPRSRYLGNLKSALEVHNVQVTVENILQAIMDVTRIPHIPSTSHPHIENISHCLCFAVHSSPAFHLTWAGYTFRRTHHRKTPNNDNKKEQKYWLKTQGGNR